MEARIRDSYEFPTDLVEEADTRGALRWTIGVIATTTAALGLTNAGAISGWASSFDPQPGVIALVHAADDWEEATARLGLGAPHARMHRVWKRMEQARWSNDSPVVQQAALGARAPEQDPTTNQ
jgi:hypothetical protein